MFLYYCLRCVINLYLSADSPVPSCSCSVFLLDRLSHELVAKVFDGGVVSDEEVRLLFGRFEPAYFCSTQVSDSDVNLLFP